MLCQLQRRHSPIAITAHLQHDAIKAVVPLWRDDAGKRGLHDSLAREFPAAGGAVLDGASYTPDAQNYSSQVAVVRDQVQQAQQQYGANDVAVMLASFEEAAQISHAAQNDPVLAGIHWYGTDGAARGNALIKDDQAAAFAERVGFPCANLGLYQGAQSIWQPLSDRIQTESGTAPDASALAAYDAAWVTMLAYLESDPAASTSALRPALVQTADRYAGATGWTALNDAGDRTSGDYDFWSIRAQSGAPQWVVTATYQVSPGSPGQIVAGQ